MPIRIKFEVPDNTPMSLLTKLAEMGAKHIDYEFVGKASKPAVEGPHHPARKRAKHKRGIKAHTFAAQIRSHYGPAHPGKEFTVKQLIADYPDVPHGTVYRALSDLLKEGWCERARLGVYRKVGGAPFLGETLTEGTQANGHA